MNIHKLMSIQKTYVNLEKTNQTTYIRIVDYWPYKKS